MHVGLFVLTRLEPRPSFWGNKYEISIPYYVEIIKGLHACSVILATMICSELLRSTTRKIVKKVQRNFDEEQVIFGILIPCAIFSVCDLKIPKPAGSTGFELITWEFSNSGEVKPFSGNRVESTGYLLTLRYDIRIITFLAGLHITIDFLYERFKLKNHPGNELARQMFHFVKDVIQGNEFSPLFEEQRRRYIRDEKLCDDSWFCQKVLIIFAEGPYPYQSIVKLKDPNVEFLNNEVFLEKRVYWGSRDYLLSKSLHYKDPTTYSSYISPEADIFSCSKHNNIKFFYKVNGTRVKCILDVVKIVYNGKEFYSVVVENRPLLSLYKQVNNPCHSISLTEDEFKEHFEVYLNELRRLLDKDPKCRSKYAIVHYKESDEVHISDILLKQFLEI